MPAAKRKKFVLQINLHGMPSAQALTVGEIVNQTRSMLILRTTLALKLEITINRLKQQTVFLLDGGEWKLMKDPF